MSFRLLEAQDCFTCSIHNNFNLLILLKNSQIEQKKEM